ncbi:3'(2'),5'-bisphosphate nucleotidase CysQ family protein [Leptodesmis sp.]|uniref:3'(2'),5'-bisphosphate nucleotidase CysQ family protein n=1 Tax=Leptodesmis sp. TaxID=3100501 RepID=UPI0040534ED2
MFHYPPFTIHPMTDPNLKDWLLIARIAGWQAADILLKTQNLELNIQNSEDGPVTEADTAANAAILTTLQTQLGTQEFGYLTEETYKLEPSSDRLQHSWVWVIDPLDGTQEFIRQTGEYAVHIALVHDHRPVLAVVVCPAVGKLYFATLNGGSFLEQRDGTIAPLRVSQRHQLEEMIVVTSRSHRNQRFNQLMARFPCQTQKSIGSLGGKIAAIADQRADVYVALSGTSAAKDWDLAAPELILTEAGGQFTHFDGSPLLYNQKDATQWGGILASNGQNHDFLCAEATRILNELGD